MQQSRWILRGVALSMGYEAIREQRHGKTTTKNLHLVRRHSKNVLSGQIMASDTISMAEAQKVGAEILFEVLDIETDDTSILGNNRLESDGKLTLTEIYRGLVDSHILIPAQVFDTIYHSEIDVDGNGAVDLDELREYVASIKPRKTEEWTVQAKRFLFSLTFWLAVLTLCAGILFFIAETFYYHGPMKVYRNLNLSGACIFFFGGMYTLIQFPANVGTHFDILEGQSIK